MRLRRARALAPEKPRWPPLSAAFSFLSRTCSNGWHDRSAIASAIPLPALALSAGELVLTRAGRRGEQGLEKDAPARGELQRVAWRLENGELTRRYWPVLDQLPETEARDVSYGLRLTALRCEILASDGQRYREWPRPP